MIGADSRLLIGADVGGTTTRLALADVTGRVLARSEQPAGNPNAVGIDVSARRIRAAIEELAIPTGSKIAAVLLGMAGFTTAIRAGEEFNRAAVPADLDVRPRIVSDLAVAFASATPLPRGIVVIAGTGSGAALIDSGTIVSRRGAWGWLLGDEGAGFWLGREAVRSTLAEVERETEPFRRAQGAAGRSLLARSVVERLGADPADPLPDLVRIPYLGTPVRLADLAPLVTGLAGQDRTAASICSEAAERLAGLVLDLRAPADNPPADHPIVVSGSVLQAPGPIRTNFIDRLAGHSIGPVLDARSGLVGALWLALRTDPNGNATDREGDRAKLSISEGIHAEFLSTIG